MIKDHFDVATLVGHTAFDHLAAAIKTYEAFAQMNLSDIMKLDWQKCFVAAGELNSLRAQERKSCVQAVILFQAMMEKVIYFAPTLGLGLKPVSKADFADMWTRLIAQISDTADRANAKAAFDNYVNGFYKAFRNPIIHGSNPADVQQIEKIRVLDVHAGMRQGWLAYDFLLAQAFAPSQIHEPSWDIMCGEHAIPNALSRSAYPDLTTESRRLMKRHMIGMRKATGS